MKDVFPTEIIIFIHTESYFYSHRILFLFTQNYLFSHTDLTDLTDINLPCGMIILTQRRRERGVHAENYRPVGSFASCRFIYFFCPAEIAEIAEI